MIVKQEFLDALIQDEMSHDTNLYSPGPYWKEKAKKISYELKRVGLKNFRGV